MVISFGIFPPPSFPFPFTAAIASHSRQTSNDSRNMQLVVTWFALSTMTVSVQMSLYRYTEDKPGDDSRVLLGPPAGD